MTISYEQLASEYFIALIKKPKGLLFERPNRDGGLTAAIITTLKIANQMKKEKDFQNWQSDVSESLAEIMLKLDKILNDLQQLRVFITEALKENIRNLYRDEIHSKIVAIQVILANAKWKKENLKPEDTDILRIKYYDLIEATSKLLNYGVYGFAGHLAVVSGCYGLILATAFLEDMEDGFESFKSQMVNYFTSALDVNLSTSIAYARNTLVNEIIKLKIDFNKVVNKRYVINWVLMQTGYGDSKYWSPARYVHINGDLETCDIIYEDENDWKDAEGEIPFPTTSIGYYRESYTDKLMASNLVNKFVESFKGEFEKLVFSVHSIDSHVALIKELIAMMSD